MLKLKIHDEQNVYLDKPIVDDNGKPSSFILKMFGLELAFDACALALVYLVRKLFS